MMAQNKSNPYNKLVWVKERTHALLFAQAELEDKTMQELADEILAEHLQIKLRDSLQPTTD